MTNVKKSEEIDPAYESYNTAIETNKDEEKQLNQKKLIKIIDEEYSEEISRRQKQIEHIEVQICKVRKLLHVLRYVLVMSYYNNKELGINGSEENGSTLEQSLLPDTQTRIHPAIKRLLHNNLGSLTKMKSKRKLSGKHSPNSTVTNDCCDTNEHIQEIKKIRLTETDNNRKNSYEKSNLTKSVTEPIINDDSVRSRQKIKHRIVVGNISKWVPTLENDNLTHKWMVYVRGPKESPDVSHIIDKVIFYLHPSYKPHDVIEVNKPPFHLSRRGWGEFNVRVQTYFKVSLNKPVDIVHSIKLDDKCTGRQTLGNETVVDLFLYGDNNAGCYINSINTSYKPKDNKISDSNSDSFIIDVDKTEEDSITNLRSTSFEHNYCFGDVNTETINEETEVIDTNSKNTENVIFLDHSYCLSPSDEESKTNVSDYSFPGPQDNNLIYGLGESYLDTNTTKNCKTSLAKLNNLSKLNSQELNRSSTIQNENSFLNNIKINHKLQNNLVSINCNSDSFVLTIPKNRFKCVGEALPYLFKRLPLFTSLANNKDYKRLCPFVSSSLNEFLNWNVGKRLNAEWSRARKIKRLLLEENIYGSKNWNTKSILMYGRSHKYSPVGKFGLFDGESPEKLSLLTCFSLNNLKSKSNKKKIFCPEDVTVNIDSDTDKLETINNRPKIDISDPSLKQHCVYVRQAALDCGIVLKSEELEGVQFNGAERLILEATKSLAENLIRRAANHAICTQNNSSNRNLIRKENVEYAINERIEMKSLTQFRRKRRDFEFFS